MPVMAANRTPLAGASHRDADGRLVVDADIPGYAPWQVVATVDDNADPPIIVTVTVQPNPARPQATRGITADVLRAVRFAPLIDLINFHQLAQSAVAGRRPKRLRPGRQSDARSRDDEFYATVAARYHDLVNVQQVKNPNVELAAELDLQRAQVRDLVLACRNRGLLTKAPAGRAGGRLTPKALAILDAGVDKPKTTRRR